jgi:hypothetical protein
MFLAGKIEEFYSIFIEKQLFKDERKCREFLDQVMINSRY